MSNKQSVNTFLPLGGLSHHKDKRAKNDFYATDPIAIRYLDKFHLLDKDVNYWECACGDGKLSNELLKLGYDVTSTDLYDYGYGKDGVDFLKCNKMFEGNIITNPPFSQVNEFILKGLELASNKLYIFGRIQLLESNVRWNNIYRYNPPIWVCPFVKRIKCYPNNKDDGYDSAMAYAWFIWDNDDDSNETKIRWLI